MDPLAIRATVQIECEEGEDREEDGLGDSDHGKVPEALDKSSPLPVSMYEIDPGKGGSVENLRAF
jgi:hypothetical protein